MPWAGSYLAFDFNVDLRFRPNLPDSNNFFLRILGFNHAPPAPEPGEELQLMNKRLVLISEAQAGLELKQAASRGIG